MTVKRSNSDPIVRSVTGWLRRFAQGDAQYLVLDPDKDHILIQFLETRPEWTLDFWDREGLLFVRSDVLRAQGALAPALT